MNFVKASAPGNLFFSGEHAVVYNVPAIICSVNKRTYATAIGRNDTKIEVNSSAFGKAIGTINNGKLDNRETERKELEILLDFCDSLIQKFEIKNGFNLEIESNVPVESGMSSSTAVLSSSLKSISELFDQKIKDKKFFEYLYNFQVKIHGGKASGSEIYSSSVGGFNKVMKIDGNNFLKQFSLGKHEFSVVVGNTLVRGPTALTVGTHIPSLQKRNPELVESSWKKIDAIVREMEIEVRNENVRRIGELMNENQTVLKDLMVSHPKLDDCINEALKAGALGAKLSGSGWGGVMFALCEKDNTENIARAIESTGAKSIITEIGSEGVRLE